MGLNVSRFRLSSRTTRRVGRLSQMALCAGLGALAVLVFQHRSPNFRDDSSGSAIPAITVPVSFASVIDDRARFRQIFCALDADHGSQFAARRSCKNALQRLGGEGAPSSRPVAARPSDRGKLLHIVIVPGMFGQCLKRWALPLQDAASFMQTQGYRVDTINVEGRSSSARNAAIIGRALPQLIRPGERLLIIGYSKGMSDVLETLSLYPQAVPAGSAVVSLSGVVSGTPLADHPKTLDQFLSAVPLPGCGPGDRTAVESISPRHRLAWLADHPLPRDRTYFSVSAFTDYAQVSWPLKQIYRLLSLIDSPNDGQVPYTDAIIPGSHLLGYLNADHWAVALPLARNVPGLRPLLAGHNDYPREILLEAIVRSVEEQLELQARNSARPPDLAWRVAPPKRR